MLKRLRIFASAAIVFLAACTSLPVANETTSTTPQVTPASAMARPGASQRFATNGKSSYAIDSAGRLWAWGDNKVGELGNGSTVDSSTPVQVQFPADLGDASIIGVADNGAHSAYALDSAGHLWAWGDNARAQLGLGHGDLANRLTPTQVRFPAALGSASIVSMATAHDDPGPVFAIDSAGHLWSWGDYNDAGQLGNGSRKGHSTPARVQFPMTLGNASIIRVEVDDDDSGYPSIYALDSAGHLWAWGDNNSRQLGNGVRSDDSLTPAQVQFPAALGFASIVSVATGTAGNKYAYALDSAGHLWAWGYNGYGQLGNGSTARQSTPIRIQFPTPWWRRQPSIVHVVATRYSDGAAYAIDSAGHLWAWGGNRDGQLGHGSLKNQPTPERIQFPSALGGASIVDVVANHYAAYATDSAGRLWAWGNNRYGQLGNGLLANRFNPPALVPFPVAREAPLIVSVVAVNANPSGAHGAFRDTDSTSAYALDSADHLWAWGYNRHGQLGNGASEIVASPVPVPFQQGLPNQAQGLIRKNGHATLAFSLLKPQFAYVANNDGISAYRLNPDTGALTEVAGSPFADYGYPQFLTVNPAGTLAFVVNAHGTVSAYRINATTGALTEIPGSPFKAGNQPYVVRVSADGTTLDVANWHSTGFSPYRIDPSTGALTPLTPSDDWDSVNRLNGYLPSPNAAVSPAAPFAYWLVNDGIGVFRIDTANGSNHEIRDLDVPNQDAKSITINPEGTLAYVTEDANYGRGSISAYHLNTTTGAITPVPGNPVVRGLHNSVAVSPGGTFAYVAGGGYGPADGTVSAYRINVTTGALTEIPGSPFATGTRPTFITVVQP